jgi:glutamate synthase (ferredoxin)
MVDGYSHHDACGVGFIADLGARPTAGILPLALEALARLGHRGAVDADGRTGDGAGVITELPHALLAGHLTAVGRPSPAPGDLAAGLVFLPREPDVRTAALKALDEVLARHSLPLLGVREVPIREDALGDKARLSRPHLVHVLVGRPDSMYADAFERALFLARRDVERAMELLGPEEFHVVSLSHRTLVYKALVRGADLRAFYVDLTRPDYLTSFALFHQRYSTNTFPSWSLTQPFRVLAHNGEINTIRGNRSWMQARAGDLASPRLGMEADLRRPLREGVSDSASLDEAIELLVRGGRDLDHAITMLMPPAWENDREMADDVRAFYEYHSRLVEPWDGPAMLAFADGRFVGAALDRNGLRPARFAVTSDGLVVLASEAGVVDLDADRVVTRGRLGPGDILAVDLQARRLLGTGAIREKLAGRRPFRQWLELSRPRPRPSPPAEGADRSRSAPPDPRAMKAFGYTREDLQLVLGPMYREGTEPMGSMGDDSALSVLSSRPRLLFSYFKQHFAQVTNPPIDPLREALVMSLATYLGPRANLLDEAPEAAAQIQLPSPLLDEAQLRGLQATKALPVRTLSLVFPSSGDTLAFRRALHQLRSDAARAVAEGAQLLVLSDRDVDAGHPALPSLLAVSSVHQELVRLGLRCRASLVADTGEARDDHQIAALLGFGAEAVCPYLALAAVARAVTEPGGSPADAKDAERRYFKALTKGLLKILSKMGISTVRSYQGAQLFEAVGIDEDVIRDHFGGTPSGVGGLGLDEIAREVLERHESAYAAAASTLLDEGSLHRYRRNGEPHAFEPPVIKALHAAIKSATSFDYRRYAELVHSREPIALRDLLEIRTGTAIALGQVEPAAAIFPRFLAAAMSLGALSPEAHEVLAVALNRIGGRSNSGEGGEDPARFWSTSEKGDSANSRIKQVASARFGVTAEYLVSADELQIKMAQGSKPGEGGQLPGHKVAEHIARLRHSQPGITLISPPPHHDIYSIEDLAQLIYDLKRVNQRATVSVKLVSEAGVGTIAAGVAKAMADAIVIGGHDGGTGASPLGSIKNAGTPWELGLSEAHRVLAESGLRSRVRLQVEGGLKTGRDVVIAALLGADEFGFGSAALVAAGCVMARQCHLNTCPAGIATQREDLRRKFDGTPERVIHFLTAVAGEVREILASMGMRSLAEAIGRSDCLAVRPPKGGGKAALVSLGQVMEPPRPFAFAPRDRGDRTEPDPGVAHIDDPVLARLRTAPDPPSVEMELPLFNSDRTVGGRIAGTLALERRGRPLPPGALRLRYHGSAGQSFGAFCIEGMEMELTGEANDYLAKGMSGGSIGLRPPAALAPAAHRHVIAGNAVLYGATGGRLFVAGRVGERFAVRNSGALAVVEGVGDHACEYMTAGVVAILGEFGRNLGAGMSGGRAYVFDPEGLLPGRYNPEMVALERGLSAESADRLRRMLEWHRQATASRRAADLLAAWDANLPLFWKVTPKDTGRGQDSRPIPSAAPRIQAVAASDRPAAAS